MGSLDGRDRLQAVFKGLINEVQTTPVFQIGDGMDTKIIAARQAGQSSLLRVLEQTFWALRNPSSSSHKRPADLLAEARKLTEVLRQHAAIPSHQQDMAASLVERVFDLAIGVARRARGRAA